MPRQLWSGSGEQGLCSLTFGAQTLALALTGCVMNQYLNLLMLQDCSSAHPTGLTGQVVTVLAHGEGLVRVSSEDVRAHLLSDSLPSRNAYCSESGHIFTLPGTFRYPMTASLPCPHQSVVKSSRQRLFLDFLCIPPFNASVSRRRHIHREEHNAWSPLIDLQTSAVGTPPQP